MFNVSKKVVHLKLKLGENARIKGIRDDGWLKRFPGGRGGAGCPFELLYRHLQGKGTYHSVLKLSLLNLVLSQLDIYHSGYNSIYIIFGLIIACH